MNNQETQNSINEEKNNMSVLDDKTILITGGSGSFGGQFVKYLLDNSKAKKIIIFSRDENKQFHMQKEMTDKRLRFFIGDIRDLSRLKRAFKDVDIVIHAAALKHVPALEYNPFEAVKSNIIGSQNVIEAGVNQKVSKILLISTDKAAYPTSLYGSTKLCAEKLFVNGNVYAPKQTMLSVVRYGNVIGSRGSIVETLLKNKDSVKKLQITHPDMTRFWITMNQTFDLVMFALKNMEGGEMFIPKIPSMKISDLFDAIAPGVEQEIIGIRPGEKLHEILLSEEESRHAVDTKDYYIILPEFHYFSDDAYQKYKDLNSPVKPDFHFTSNENDKWITKNELLELLK